MPISISKIQADKKTLGNSEKSWLNRDIQLFGTKWNDGVKKKFFSEWLTLLEAGVEILPAIQLLAEETTESKKKQTLEEIKEELLNGTTLAHSMESVDKFTIYDIICIKIGESSGKLTDVLRQLSVYYTEKVALKKKVTQAMIYPMVVLATSLLALTFLMMIVVPIFSQAFVQFGGELPQLTQWVIALSEGFRSYGFMIFPVTFLLVLIYRSIRSKLWFRSGASGIVRKMPLIGIYIQHWYLARFMQAMALLIRADVDLLSAIRMMGRAITWFPMEEACAEMERCLLKGESLHHIMQNQDVFTKRTVTLVRVGEEVNRLGDMFQTIAKQSSEDLKARSMVMTTLLEPAMIVLMAIMVGVILVAMYLPIFELSTQFGS